MTLALRTGLSVLLATGALGFAAGEPQAQDYRQRYDRTVGIGEDSVLVTPNGTILDFIPEAGEAQTYIDERGRTVLVDNWGNIIATVMPAERATRGEFRRRNAERDVYVPDDDTYTGSVPEFRDVAPGSVEREELPNSLPDIGVDPNDTAAIDPNDMPALEPGAPDPNRQTLAPAMTITSKSRPEITALQVFLDREGFSPGVIDGKIGSNVTKAIEAFQQATGETLDPNDTDTILERLRLNGGLPITSYEITAADAAGPYVASIPEDYAHKAMLPELSFTSTAENLAERFHMDEAYLRELNPGVDFTIPGTVIKVVNPGNNRQRAVTRIVADKFRKQVLAYDAGGTLLAAYPATIGSSDTPSPSGTVTVERIAFNPGYTYNPKINFKQGENDKVLTLQPGPNGPVGTVWIALSKPTYGIHGTPEPSKIGKTQSHGCVRLTNWDATELGKMVSKGVTVEFLD